MGSKINRGEFKKSGKIQIIIQVFKKKLKFLFEKNSKFCWRHSSRFVLRTGTNGPGHLPPQAGHLDYPFIPVRNTAETNGARHSSRRPHPGSATGTNGPYEPERMRLFPLVASRISSL
jgi:hypothetical protein